MIFSNVRNFFLSSILSLLCLFSQLSAQPENLSLDDVNQTVNELLEHHILYHEMNPELIQRTLANYIHILDPSKQFFLKNEIKNYLS